MPRWSSASIRSSRTSARCRASTPTSKAGSRSLRGQGEAGGGLRKSELQLLFVVAQAIQELWPQHGRGDLSALQLQISESMPQAANQAGVALPDAPIRREDQAAYIAPLAGVAPGAVEKSKTEPGVVLGDGTVILSMHDKVPTGGYRTEAGHVVPGGPGVPLPGGASPPRTTIPPIDAPPPVYPTLEPTETADTLSTPQPRE